MADSLNITPLPSTNFFSIDFAMIDGQPVIHELNPMVYSGANPDVLAEAGYNNARDFVRSAAEQFSDRHLDGITVIDTLSHYRNMTVTKPAAENTVTEALGNAYACLVQTYIKTESMAQEALDGDSIKQACITRYGNASLDTVMRDPQLRDVLFDVADKYMADNHGTPRGSLDFLRVGKGAENTMSAFYMILSSDNVSKEWQAAFPGLNNLLNFHFPNHADPFIEYVAINKGLAALAADMAFDSTPDYLPEQSLIVMSAKADDLQRTQLLEKFGDGPVVYKPLVAHKGRGCTIYDNVDALLADVPNDYRSVHARDDMSDQFAYDGNRFMTTPHPFGVVQSLAASDPVEHEGALRVPSYRIFVQCYTDAQGRMQVDFPDGGLCYYECAPGDYNTGSLADEGILRQSPSLRGGQANDAKAITGDELAAIQAQFSNIMPELMTRYEALNMEAVIYDAACSDDPVKQLYAMSLAANEALYQPCFTPESGFVSALAVASNIPLLSHPVGKAFSYDIYDTMQKRLDALFPGRPPENIRILEHAILEENKPISFEESINLMPLLLELISDLLFKSERVEAGENIRSELLYYNVLYDVLEHCDDVMFDDDPSHSAHSLIQEFLDMMAQHIHMTRDDYGTYNYHDHAYAPSWSDIGIMSQGLANNAAAMKYLDPDDYRNSFIGLQDQVDEHCQTLDDFLPIAQSRERIAALKATQQDVSPASNDNHRKDFAAQLLNERAASGPRER